MKCTFIEKRKADSFLYRLSGL